MLKNEACYSDCVQIMDEYERQLTQWYTQLEKPEEVFYNINDCYELK